MASRVSKLDSALVLSALVVWAGLTLYIVNRLLHGQVAKLHGLAQHALVAGAFLGCGLLNVLLVYALIGRRESSGGLRLTIATVILVAGLVDVYVLYTTWHDAQLISV